jgi:hypothetical protein
MLHFYPGISYKPFDDLTEEEFSVLADFYNKAQE